MNNSKLSVNFKLNRIRTAFLKQLPAQLEVIRSAYQSFVRGNGTRDRLEDLHRRIHTVRGAAASFRIGNLAALAAAAEQLAKNALQAETQPERIWFQQMQEYLAGMEQAAGQIDLTEEMEFQAREITASAPSGAGSERKVVYLCEDDSFQRLALTTQIQCFGFEVVSFGDLEQLARAVRHASPDALVMDVIYPDRPSGGIEIIREIRSGAASEIPTVFISSRDDLGARLSSVRAGSSAYFVKPVNVLDLCTTLSGLTSVLKPELYRILIVDDDPQSAEYHAVILQEAGMVTETVNDPLQVLAHLSRFKPDLILMDMYMPGCNGMELAKAIRQINAYFSIPIVFLSSETDTDKQFDAMRMGGDEFLTKPVKPQHLVTSVAIRAERMKTILSFMVRDGMTGLFNHSASKEQLDAAIDTALRNGNDLCLAMIDVDFFKKVNDSYGHPVGDRVLIALARLLRQRLRRTDVVGRYGGEEFVAILPKCALAEALPILDQLRESYAALSFSAKEEEFSSTFSCGVASLSGFADAASLLKAADEALYEAKRLGRNQVVCAGGE